MVDYKELCVTVLVEAMLDKNTTGVQCAEFLVNACQKLEVPDAVRVDIALQVTDKYMEAIK